MWIREQGNLHKHEYSSSVHISLVLLSFAVTGLHFISSFECLVSTNNKTLAANGFIYVKGKKDADTDTTWDAAVWNFDNFCSAPQSCILTNSAALLRTWCYILEIPWRCFFFFFPIMRCEVKVHTVTPPKVERTNKGGQEFKRLFFFVWKSEKCLSLAAARLSVLQSPRKSVTWENFKYYFFRFWRWWREREKKERVKE